MIMYVITEEDIELEGLRYLKDLGFQTIDGIDISPEIFYKIGLAAGNYVKNEIKGNRLAVGNDIRKSSLPLVHSFISGVSATGIDVVYTGTTAFGQTLFKGWELKEDLIAFVTTFFIS